MGVKTKDKESFLMARKMIRFEALLCGGSCGSAMAAAIRFKANNIGKGKRVVVLCPDSVRNYMTKFLSDDWMMDNGFLERKENISEAVQKAAWCNSTVSELKLNAPEVIESDVTVKQAIGILQSKGFSQIPVSSGADIIGVVTDKGLTAR